MKIITCEFDTLWLGKCTNHSDDSNFCNEHKETKCISCESQATHVCKSSLSDLICDFGLCDSPDCHMVHLYKFHTKSIPYIDLVEDHYGFNKAPILIAPMRDPDPGLDNHYVISIMYYNTLTKRYELGFLYKEKRINQIIDIINLLKEMKIINNREILKYTDKIYKHFDAKIYNKIINRADKL